ncbi:hypothetical protein O3P69_009462 [Scylla paramamosain]|uniref:Uncharacterized protein n=1 Tax=Scylla paramamosain TaxID=85552 RepID=A0AAW0SU27_SCYPA
MKKLLGDKYTSFDKELFLQLFYQRLPPDTQRCLFTVKNKLSVDELATLADEFMATLPQGLDVYERCAVSATATVAAAIFLLVLLTFDDAVNDLKKSLYKDLINVGRKDPNGCPIASIMYVSHKWTDYSQVQDLYDEGHEIASHSSS